MYLNVFNFPHFHKFWTRSCSLWVDKHVAIWKYLHFIPQCVILNLTHRLQLCPLSLPPLCKITTRRKLVPSCCCFMAFPEMLTGRAGSAATSIKLAIFSGGNNILTWDRVNKKASWFAMQKLLALVSCFPNKSELLSISVGINTQKKNILRQLDAQKANENMQIREGKCHNPKHSS